MSNQDGPLASPSGGLAGELVDDLPMFWGGRARALRILNGRRKESDAATIEAAKAYDECAGELSTALRQAEATAAPPTVSHDGEIAEALHAVARFYEMEMATGGLSVAALRAQLAARGLAIYPIAKGTGR